MYVCTYSKAMHEFQKCIPNKVIALKYRNRNVQKIKIKKKQKK